MMIFLVLSALISTSFGWSDYMGSRREAYRREAIAHRLEASRLFEASRTGYDCEVSCPTQCEGDFAEVCENMCHKVCNHVPGHFNPEDLTYGRGMYAPMGY